MGSVTGSQVNSGRLNGERGASAAAAGGTVVDGSGNAPFTGDVGIRDGRIAQVGGKLGPARRDIDATGAIVSAINDALRPLGAEVNSIPATPRRVLSAIEAAKARSAQQ